MRRIFIYNLTIACLWSLNVFAQNIRPIERGIAGLTVEEMVSFGDEFYQNRLYFQAYQLYYEARKKGEQDSEIKLKMASALAGLRQYSQAIDMYDQMIASGEGSKLELTFRKAKLLKATGDEAEAIKLFKLLVEIEGDEELKSAARDELTKIEEYKNREASKAITLLTSSTDNVFGITAYNEEFVVSGVELLSQKYKQQYKMFEGRYDSLFYNKLFYLDASDDEMKLKSEVNIDPLNDHPLSYGSPSYNHLTSTLYLTVASNFDYTISPKIYYTTRKGGKWSKLNVLKGIGEQSANVMHPCVVPLADSSAWLFYASDKEGGFGGLDIWKAKLSKNGEVLDVENMGEFINTSGNEETPFYDIKSRNLFFSSNGQKGVGEQDIYMVAYDTIRKAGKLFLLPPPVNSFADDRYFTLDATGTKGFVTTNREASDSTYKDKLLYMRFEEPHTLAALPPYLTEVNEMLASDSKFKPFEQLFTYRVLPVVAQQLDTMQQDEVTWKGIILKDGQPVVSEMVLLVDDKDSVLAVATTDNEGRFSFKNLPKDGNYLMVLNEDDKDMSMQLQMEDVNGDVLATYEGSEAKRFYKFRNLEMYAASLAAMENVDASSFKQGPQVTVWEGTMMNGGTPVAGHIIVLVDANDNVIAVCTTEEGGKFRFQNLPSDGDYLMVLSEEDKDMTLLLNFRDKDENLIKRFDQEGSKRYYKFKTLPEHQARLAMMNEQDSGPMEMKLPADTVKTLEERLKGAIPLHLYQNLESEFGQALYDIVDLRVQIGAYRHPTPGMFNFLKDIPEIDEVKVGEVTKFLIGHFKEIKDAEPLRQSAFNQGVNDAFVAIYVNGLRVAIIIYEEDSDKKTTINVDSDEEK